VYFTAWPFSKHQVLHWPVARAKVEKDGRTKEGRFQCWQVIPGVAKMHTL